MRLLKFLCITATLAVLGTSAAFAQANWQDGKFTPVVAQSSVTDTEDATLHLIGILNDAGSTAPYRFEWRKNSPDGKVMDKGSITPTAVDPNRTEKGTKLTVKKPGTYYLVVYDASTPGQRVAQPYKVHQLIQQP